MTTQTAQYGYNMSYVVIWPNFNLFLCHMQVRAEAAETIDREMKKRGVVNCVFYETSALSGQNLDEFAKTFGMCLAYIYTYLYR